LKEVLVGRVVIGGNYIPLQSMIKNPVTDTELTLSKISELQKVGCDIVRISIPDIDSSIALKTIVSKSPIPIVADIHFDHRLAIRSIEAGVHKVRINPGNIGNEHKVKQVVDCLKTHQIPVRIGINGGSIDKEILRKNQNDKIAAMIESAAIELDIFDRNNYDNIVLSFKSSGVMETIKVNQIAAAKFGIPLHIGVTEAGDMIDGTIKNSIGISHLLLNNIGNTLRVSLTDSEVNEIYVAKKILESIGRRQPEIEIISCPTCGRTEGEIKKIVSQIKSKISGRKFSKSLKIAIMGCIVNGPGEACESDFGVACGKSSSVIFKRGIKIKTVKNSSIYDELISILDEYNEI